MTMREFTWRPLRENEGVHTFRTLVAQFGDGYAQRAGDGINLRKGSWQLEFIGTNSEIEDIKTFLDDHAGYMSFLYRPTLQADPVAVVTPQGYTVTPRSPLVASLKVTIEENNRLAP